MWLRRTRLLHNTQIQTDLQDALEPAAVHAVKVENVVQHLRHHAQASLERLELNLLFGCHSIRSLDVLERQEGCVKRYADLVENVGRETALAVACFPLVNLCLLCRAELDLELVP